MKRINVFFHRDLNPELITLGIKVMNAYITYTPFWKDYIVDFAIVATTSTNKVTEVMVEYPDGSDEVIRCEVVKLSGVIQMMIDPHHMNPTQQSMGLQAIANLENRTCKS